MTKTDFLENLKVFTEEAVKDLLLPFKPQTSQEKPEDCFRAADIYLMRLKEGKAAEKKAPYILHQVITSRDEQPESQEVNSKVVVRSIFCVYNADEQEGGLQLLGLIERFRIAVLKQVLIANRYQIDLVAGLEGFIYPEDTTPFYIGEMVSTWILPAVKREVKELWQ